MKNLALKIYFLLIFLLIIPRVFSQNVGINPTGTRPNTDAGLDIDFPDKGLLIPRVVLNSTVNSSPLSAHVAGMIVYNTATSGDVFPGFYYNDGAHWISGFPVGTKVGDMLYWNGSAWTLLAAGTSGQYLQLNGSNQPYWADASSTGGPVLTTSDATSITGNTAVSGGTISSDGGSPVISRGVCWKLTTGPTIADNKTSDGSGVGNFTSNLTGLSPATTYYVRAYAMSSSIINYGNEITFTTSAVLPTLGATTAATSITGNSAVSGGNITNDGGAPILERGVCYSTIANPTIANSKVVDPGTGTGSFTSNLTGLSGYTTYYVRAYATNSAGTAYGAQISFTTSRIPPTVVTTNVTNIQGASAVSGGSMSWNGGGYSNYQAYGVAYSTVPNSPTPTKVATNTTNYPVNINVPINPWTTTITGLASNTTYYARAYLDVYSTTWTTIYGNEISFTTGAPSAPILATTTAASLITASTATSGGSITSDGGSPITAKGVCWSTSPNATLDVNNFTTNGTGTGTFSGSITGLTANTTYYVRSYATNSVGTSYGPEISFTTCMTPIYTIGQQVGGGTVFYVDCTGHGLIAAPKTAEVTSVVWGCSGTAINTPGTLGTGASNTAAILAKCATRPIAASVAAAYNGGGFTDWYLPSTQELKLMMDQATLLQLGGTYWSSSDNNSTTVASTYYYISSPQASSAVKTYSATVRMIRAF